MSETATEPGAAYIGPPDLHIRDRDVVSPAGLELYQWCREWRARHALTDMELLFILNRLQMEFVDFLVRKDRGTLPIKT